MSAWTHLICTPCWNARNPDRSTSEIEDDHSLAPCCFCGRLTGSGIYVREDPRKTLCEGTGQEHAP